MRTTFIGAVMIMAFIFTSCQKELSSNSGIPGVVTAADSNYLSKIYDIDTTVTPTDTAGISSFFYDNLHRVTKVAYYDYVAPSSDNDVVYFSYNGTDSMPYKTVEYFHEDVSSTDTIYSYYTYNAKGKLTKDSTITRSSDANFDALDLSNYTYTGNAIFGSCYQTQDNYPGSIKYFNDTATVDVSGNIQSLREYEGYDFSIPFDKQFEIGTTLDNKLNIFTKLHIAPLSGIFPFGNDPAEFIDNPQVNNITHINVDEGVYGIQTYDLLLKYNTSGYVSEERYAGDASKSIYVYIKL